MIKILAVFGFSVFALTPSVAADLLNKHIALSLGKSVWTLQGEGIPVDLSKLLDDDALFLGNGEHKYEVILHTKDGALTLPVGILVAIRLRAGVITDADVAFAKLTSAVETLDAANDLLRLLQIMGKEAADLKVKFEVALNELSDLPEGAKKLIFITDSKTGDEYSYTIKKRSNDWSSPRMQRTELR